MKFMTSYIYTMTRCKAYHQLFVLFLLVVLVFTDSDCDNRDDQFLITFHPHLDAFWLNTDDELKDINFRPAGFLYAMNQRNSKTIFNSMLLALNQNSSRRYFVSEIVFFQDWFYFLNNDQKGQVRKLVANGQLEIANAGWVQNDQAVCYVDDIIDQYTIGLDFMYKQFQVQTKIGWATDSFGHSHSQVAIEHLLGFEFQGIERIDDRYIYMRQGGPLLEFYWSAVSDSNNRKYGGVLTYIRHFLHEVNDYRRQSPQSIASDFQKVKQNMNKLYGKNKHFRFLGNDFQQFVPLQFQQLEGAYKLLNGNNKCAAFKYGNPSDYLQLAKTYYKAKGVNVRQNDFMPNYDQDHYWSGYYTTDPQLKKICKDYSRLINYCRKVYTKHLVNGGPVKPNLSTLIRQADQLLSIMQHHDGITATSKYHIQNLFKQRMNSKTKELLTLIAELKGLPQQICNFHQGGNSCPIVSQADKLYFTVLHEGTVKQERLQLQLPTGIFYDVEGNDQDNIFCNSKSGKCNLVFVTDLYAGENVLILKKVSEESFKDKIFRLTKTDSNKFNTDSFTLNIESSELVYIFDNDFYRFGLVKSPNRNSNTGTTTWNKYGQRINKNQNRIPGIYIMANDGSLNSLPQAQFTELYAVKGTYFTKIIAVSSSCEITITVTNSKASLIDIDTSFRPSSREQNDYFLQIKSSLNGNNEFFHDMNGYLVSKRKAGYRPDYEWTYKPEDKINANTYPTCSFAYAIQGDKKLVVFLDRAAGVTMLDGALLINIDRLCGDDYKGVGEGYSYQVLNTFRYKLGMVSAKDHIEREWQRTFDDALIGMYSEKERSSVLAPDSQVSKYFKYTIYILNQDEFVLRLYNLAEEDNLNLKRFTQTSWKIPELGLDLTFADIKQSFASGIPMSERKSWINIPGQINMFNGASKDTQEQLVLSPLQIRAFRINIKGKISINNKAQSSQTLNIEDNKQVQPQKGPLIDAILKEIKPIKKPYGKRCF